MSRDGEWSRDHALIERTWGGLRVRGISIAGVETCLELPDLGLCFDIGRCPPTAVSCGVLLLTHGHPDHLGGLVHHLSLRALQRMSPPTLIAPAGLAKSIGELVQWWERTTRTRLPHMIFGVRPGDSVELPRGLIVDAFKASHRVEALAYSVRRRRSRLRPEFAGLPGPELEALRGRGVDVKVPFEERVVAFTGDSRAALLDREPAIRQAKLLIGECTWLWDQGDGTARRRADQSGHMTLNDWAERASLLENEAILLTHFSQRYSCSEVRSSMLDLPDELRARVCPFVPDEEPSDVSQRS
jgi:ribonuclease Z